MFEVFSLNVKGNVIPIEKDNKNEGLFKKRFSQVLTFYKSLSSEKLIEAIDLILNLSINFIIKK